MRKLLYIFIITVLSLPVFAADVDFMTIPGHPKQTILHFDYNRVYKCVSDVYRYMPYNKGYSIRQAEYEKWFVANIGYFMYEYNAWYVYAIDKYTEATAIETSVWINNSVEDVDITDGLIHGLEHPDGQEEYLVLRSGPNFYVLNSIYLNDWVFHLH